MPPDVARPVPWHPRAFLLNERPDFTLDPAMHQGAYYVQDPSSMFIAEILRQILPDLPELPRVLDLCAAPGGQSTALIDLLPDGSLMVSNEYDFRRAEILKENIIKWGYPYCIVTRGDTARYRSLPDCFDLVVVDAPCSGEGMMRKDPKAREQWSPALVGQCASLQEEILDNATATLRPGGYLVYSTCTFNTSENESQVSRLIASGAFSQVKITTDPEWNILSEAPGHSDFPSLRFLPGRVEGEGYTVAVLRKTGGSAEPRRSAFNYGAAKAASKKTQKGTRGATGPRQQKLPEAELLSRVPASPRSRLAVYREGEIAAIPEAIYPAFIELSRCLDIIHAGVTVAETKGRDYLPTQSLAMLAGEVSHAFPAFEVDTATAIDYLRRQAVALPDEAPKGFLLLTNNNLPLGFVKNLGNRANNLYPSPWRILKS